MSERPVLASLRSLVEHNYNILTPKIIAKLTNASDGLTIDIHAEESQDGKLLIKYNISDNSLRTLLY